MQKVYIIEDDEGITQQMRQALEKWHFAVSSVADFEAIDTEVKQCQPNIIVMDITLPYFDGFFWTQKIRTFSQVPIIFVSAASLDPNAIRAIAIGADDYLTKPFSTAVFISKIQAILRRIGQYDDFTDTITCGNYSLSIVTNILQTPTNFIKLTATEIIILRLLMLNPNQTISKEKIIKRIWQNGDFTDENILNVNISRLRDKLTQVGLKNRLTTEYGKGYKFIS